MQAQTWCWSKVNGLSGGGGYQDLTASHPGVVVAWEFPMLVAAVDPAAEAKLDDLPHALTSGHYLAENAGPGTISSRGTRLTTFPVLAAARAASASSPRPRCGGWPIRPGRRCWTRPP